MFSHIEIRGHILSIKTITIIIGLLCFVLVGQDAARKNGVSVTDFIGQITPIFISTIVLGSWTSFVISQGFTGIRMISITNLLLPDGFQLHFLGVAIGFFLSLYISVLRKKSILERSRRVSIYATTTIKTLTVLGLVFILGDDVIGKTTTSSIGIRGFQETSRVSALGKVIPVGMVLSLIGIIILTASSVRPRVIKGRGIFALFFVLCPVFLYRQHYPRYGVAMVGGFLLDIKIYFCIGLAIVLGALAYLNRSGK